MLGTLGTPLDCVRCAKYCWVMVGRVVMGRSDDVPEDAEMRLSPPTLSEIFEKIINNPIGSMYGILNYIWVMYGVNVSKYAIRGSYGNDHEMFT